MNTILITVFIFFLCLASYYGTQFLINKFSPFKSEGKHFIAFFIAIWFSAMYYLIITFL
ncbi:hypothetical protein GCM10007190_17330 [Macrococcus hajekii]|nr:hypothetical protein GCM10007190_17330 [Macrococcus hajekii]